MSNAAEQLYEAALGLSEDESAELADRLWESIDGDTQEEIAAAWATEIKRRLDMIERGEGHFLTHEEVWQRLDAKYGKLES